MTIQTFGPVEPRALQQLERCAAGVASGAVLCADHHVGYSQPIGGAVAYPEHVSPSGVGYDIGCGNKAVLTDAHAGDFEVGPVMDEIVRGIGFGMGRPNPEQVDHPVLDEIRRAPVAGQKRMLRLAASQLGTVGAGNHYVDLFADEASRVWIGVHFGSRGFGHKTASGFLAMAQGKEFDERAGDGGMDAAPILLRTDSALGEDYLAAMELAGRYAYAGRDLVCGKVLQILGAKALDEVHNHHNYAWFEDGAWVVRKGCTPAFPGQRGFVGATMGDVSVILEGVESETSRAALYSTVHGAGRVLSRTQAAGKAKYVKGRAIRSGGVVDWPAVRARLAQQGVELRGGAADEAPEAYKRLDEVLGYHVGTIRVLQRLTPLGVAMAGEDTLDPYKD